MGQQDYRALALALAVSTSLTAAQQAILAANAGLKATAVYTVLQSGTTLADRITSAHALLPSSGGTIDMTGEPSATVNSFALSKPCLLRWGIGTYTWASGATVTLGATKSIIVEGYGPFQTQLKGASGVDKLFTFSGVSADGEGKSLTVVQRLTLDGASLATNYGIYTPDNGGSFTMSAGTHIVRECLITGFATAGIWFGVSVFFNYVTNNYIIRNTIGLHSGENSDCLTYGNVFGYAGAGPMLEMDGAQQRVLNNTFTGGGGAGDGPDIRIRNGVSTSGNIWIKYNYHGTEGETHTARFKIEVVGADTTKRIPSVKISENEYLGIAGQTCIDLANPIQGWRITHNTFRDFSTIINDRQSPTTTSAVPFDGHSIFKDNIVEHQVANNGCSLFANGGRGFSVVQYPPGTNGITLPFNNGLTQNRIRSEDFTAAVDSYSWNPPGSITVTSGEADPAGTTKAAKFTCTSSASIGAKFNVSSLLTDSGVAASGANGRVYVSAWLKKDTLNYLDMVVFNLTDSYVIAGHRIKLSAAWRKEGFVVTGLDPSKTYKLLFYPGGVSSAGVSGNFWGAFFQVSDFGNDYVAGTGAAIVAGGTFKP